MGSKFQSQSISGYNASPPSDDGTASSANQLKWSNTKSKIGDPLKTYIEDIEAALLTYFDESAVNKTTSYTTVADDNNRIMNVTASVTLSLGDAGTMGAGYVVTVKNSHSSAITVSRGTGTDTLDGSVSDFTLQPGHVIVCTVNEALDGYLIIGNYNKGYFTDAVTLLSTLAVTGAVTLSDALSVAGKLSVISYAEKAISAGTGGAITLDLSSGTYFYTGTLASIPTFTFSNPSASGLVTSFTLELNNAVAYAPVWPSSVEWPESTEPTWSNGKDTVMFVTRDGGTSWQGYLGGRVFG